MSPWALTTHPAGEKRSRFSASVAASLPPTRSKLPAVELTQTARRGGSERAKRRIAAAALEHRRAVKVERHAADVGGLEALGLAVDFDRPAASGTALRCTHVVGALAESAQERTLGAHREQHLA